MRARPALVGLSFTALVVTSAAAGTAIAPRPAAADDTTTTTIVVGATAPRGPAATQLLGINHRYNADGYGLWNPRRDAPRQVYVDGAVRAGVESLRFPGGTVANTYEWKRAIGDDRGCQIDGRGSAAAGFSAIDHDLSFGPDEFMTTVDAMGVQPLIMVPFVRETPEDAADWVEYMNTPAGDGVNPNGGVDWAELRAANGHPEPYGVQRWELGNEHHHLDSRHWMSPDTATAAGQYAFGGSASFVAEPLGKGCNHPVEGVASDGTGGQVFQVMYPPVDPATLQVAVQENGRLWRQVPDIGATRPRARVYEVRPDSGEIVFGDGTHGRIPKQGKQFVATYDSVHEGYFAFAEAMKGVDPTIDVCASFGRVVFLQTVEGQPFDCLTTHPITSLAHAGEAKADWVDALEGHDHLMVAVDQRRRGVSKLQRAMPEGTPLWFTEAAAVQGDGEAFPRWATSASQAAYMASMWGDWMELGIPFAMSSVLLGGDDRALLDSRPQVTLSAEGVTRQAIKPMFSAGGEVLPARVDGNPVRSPEGFERSYDGLAVTATRAPDGSVNVMVVNRLPEEAVTSQLSVEGLVPTSAELRTVVADRFTASNTDADPSAVRLELSTVPVDASGFVLTFPPSSTTVVRLPPPA
jgi:alpha-N-arabinofuranosidase